MQAIRWPDPPGRLRLWPGCGKLIMLAGGSFRVCVGHLGRLEPASVDLAFADPPFNIGYKYDLYKDRCQSEQYLDWTRVWGQAIQRVLKPNGTFWLAIGDEYAAELKLLFQKELGF